MNLKGANLTLSEYSPQFYISLGYLASSKRATKIDIETHPKRSSNLEREYYNITREKLSTSVHNYLIWDWDKNKWGSELRIYFIQNNNIPSNLDTLVRSAPLSSSYNARINNNELVWKLIKYGFRPKNYQDTDYIKSKIPSPKLSEFNKGLNL